ncbi:hypothetical protein IPM44_04150 [bacterium]|nr:MAG: hypothetical protein IPM44_04150 [bacterium]
MRLKVVLLLAIGLMYYGYVRENTDRAMQAFEGWKTSYLTIIDQATAGEIPSTWPNSSALVEKIPQP